MKTLEPTIPLLSVAAGVMGLCGGFPALQAWDTQGHVIIAQIAHQSVEPKTRNALQQLFARTRFPTHMEIYRQMHIPVWVAQSVLPDRPAWRFQSAERLWKKRGAVWPSDWDPQWGQATTASWHYVNTPYYPEPEALVRCAVPVDQGPHWDQLIPALIQAGPAFHTLPKTQRVLIIFLLHLVADAHQPLHAFSAVNPDCQLDKGGNTWCLSASKKLSGHCRWNLHQYWDAGLHTDPGKTDARMVSQALIQQYPRAVFGEDRIRDLDPAHWIEELWELRDQVYDLDPETPPSPSYAHKQRETAARLFALAGYRLAAALDQIWRTDPPAKSG